ncbi:hypothetical protein LSTR_LSTR014096 [Laodelphax striatellus]|uniref:PDZ domain-containing protein n=1 Tax=Laodelphax striatellus TaxID=195883 RepID=A0A482XSM9_LAOST|nr:hypothetical protein LSTR_LSTR014096 [Laodelphax striatellus]
MLGGHLPPSDLSDAADKPPPRRPSPGPRVDPRTLPVRTVSMSRGNDPAHGFGICVKGGTKDQDSDSEGVGVYISRVEEGSVAERVGLRPGDSILEVNGTPFTSISHEDALKIGDQILEVNGQSFMDVSHDEAVNQLKLHKRMSLIVRDVGKVPHSCTAYDHDPCDAASQRSVHYVLSFYTLLTELREVVAPEDRAHFDELVYRRESEGQRLQHLLDPRHVTRRKGGGNPISCCDNNHATLMSNLHDLPGPVSSFCRQFHPALSLFYLE